MDGNEDAGACPHCGFRDVPTLIIGSSGPTGSGARWRCHSCRGTWSDRELFAIPAS